MKPSFSYSYNNEDPAARSRSRERFLSEFSSNNPFLQYQQQPASNRSLDQRSSLSTGWPVGGASTEGRSGGFLNLTQGEIGRPSVLPGYIPPGTHQIPPQSPQHQLRRGQSTGFLPQLQHQPRRGFLPNSYQGRIHEPIFPEEEETFFPPDALPLIPNTDELDYGGGYSLAFLDQQDERTREKFGERLASFPELPLDAHRRIFQMGNEIVDCFEVRLERFYRGSLLDSVSGCTAVFTKKERTGQRWLMVFKEDISRTVVKFNRLLTHSLLVSIISETAIEVEATKSMHGPHADMCVINFRNKNDATRFIRTLEESQTTAWNHREVTQEQRMKNLFSRINVASAQNELLINSQSAATAAAAPPPRSSFTLRERDQNSHRANTTKSLAFYTKYISDSDHNWRSRAFSADEETPCVVSVAQSRNELTKNRSDGSIYNSMTYKNALKMDGSRDTSKNSAKTEDEPIPEEILLEVLDIKIFVRTDWGYQEIGPGSLRLVDHGDFALDELKLLRDDKTELLHQFIYKWNSITKRSNRNRNWICCWDGAATMAPTADAVPERRSFKVHFDDEEIADRFFNAFQRSVEKGKKEIVRKRHISWFLKARRQPANSTNSANANSTNINTTTLSRKSTNLIPS